MLNVMIIRDGARKTDLLRETLQQAGIAVIAEISPCLNLEEVIQNLNPDVVLIDSDAPSRDTLESICVTSRSRSRPVVMFTDNEEKTTIREALSLGVAAYVVGSVDSTRIQSLLKVAIERFEVEESLRKELSSTKQKLLERQWVDKAKALLMRLKGLDEDAAYRLLRERAMQSQRRIGEVAKEMVEVAGWLGS